VFHFLSFICIAAMQYMIGEMLKITPTFHENYHEVNEAGGYAAGHYCRGQQLKRILVVHRFHSQPNEENGGHQLCQQDVHQLLTLHGGDRGSEIGSAEGKRYSIPPYKGGGAVGAGRGADMSLTGFHHLWGKNISQNIQAVADQGCHLEGSSPFMGTAYWGSIL
jgi:hypothetical protein